MTDTGYKSIFADIGKNTLAWLLSLWVKGSSIGVILIVLALIMGQDAPDIVGGSDFVNWVLMFVIMVSPLGAILIFVTFAMLWVAFWIIGLATGGSAGTTKVAKTVIKPLRIFEKKSDSPDKCPYTGNVVITHKPSMKGLDVFDTNETAFVINDDWTVDDPHSILSKAGYIDSEGCVYGSPLWKGQSAPDHTSILDEVLFKVDKSGSVFDPSGNKFAHLVK